MTAPASYTLTVYGEQRLVYVSITATLSKEEIAKLDSELGRLPDSHRDFDQIVDVTRGSLLNLTRGTLQAWRRRPPFFSDRSHRAFVAPRDLDFGVLRMAELMNDTRPGEIRVFRDVREALEWLDVDPDVVRNEPAFSGA